MLLLAVVVSSASLAGESIAVALLALAALVVGGPRSPRAGRMLAGAGLGVLALDAHLSARWSPVDLVNRPRAADRAEWVWQALAAQVQTPWASLLGVLLLVAGVVMMARARPAEGRRGEAWSAWVVALIIAVVVGGAYVLMASYQGIGTVAARLPILMLIGAAIALPVAAGRRGWRVAVPATAGALLLVVAVLNADIFSVAPPLPPAPEPNPGNVLAPSLVYSVSLDPGGFYGRPGLFGATLPALAMVSAVLVLALIPLARDQRPAEPS
jgi:hypothetical protein